MIARSLYRTTDIPNKPGVYVFRDRMRTVIYVGKAKSLRKRLSSYFQPSRKNTGDPKLRSLINSIAWYELHPVRTENEAMLLESRLIKQYSPRYNVLLRDDKRFLLIRIDLNEPFPRLTLARLRKDDGCRYFGPFPHAGVLRSTVDYLTRFFGLRSCRPRLPDESDFKHCVDHIVRFCKAPCVARIDRDAYHELVQQLISVIEGKTADVVVALNADMAKCVEKQRFEKAAVYRDMIDNIQTVFGDRNRTFGNTTLTTENPGIEAVKGLQKALDLAEAPSVIECFDNSNLFGSSAVSSMVCFIDGAAAKKEYRHYRVREVEGIDDFATMTEVVRRRYRRLLAESRPLPGLVVIDGGLGQLHAAYKALEELDLAGLPIIGLAKREESIFTIFSNEPIMLERHDPALKLVQAMRDEAHRFAITFHRDLRRKRILDSLLDEIPGVGKQRRQLLLKAFGSVRNLRKHTAAEIIKRVPGVGQALAASIVEHLKRRPAQ
ncbi:MAG: excinuclease ABC subunit C [Rhodothermales bacterium]|jgi:excinuclease ABC subunit C